MAGRIVKVKDKSKMLFLCF